MKLKKIHIDAYQHLENIELDCTYPEGHPKAGQPLDKICIIGQSATGKTTLLELVKRSCENSFQTDIVAKVGLTRASSGGLHFDFGVNLKGNLVYQYDGEPLTIFNDRVVKDNKELIFNLNLSGGLERLLHKGLKLVYIGADVISKESIHVFNQNPQEFNSELSELRDTFSMNEAWQKGNYIFEFATEINRIKWIYLLYKILDYRKRFTQLASELINKGSIGDMTKLNKEYSKWAETNENPLVSFADSFNPVLASLNLEIDLVNTEYPVPVKSKLKDEVIPMSGLSTGTKGLLLSMFPLYELDTNDAIILVDEPERSLFPDMQVELMGHYQRLAPNAQFIVATHSPFIAAAFEPEERFVLYFDDEGKVAVRRGVSPIGDDPNDMLRNDFKVNYYNHFGQKAYSDYIALRQQAMQETNAERKKELILEATRLGDKYNF